MVIYAQHPTPLASDYLIASVLAGANQIKLANATNFNTTQFVGIEQSGVSAGEIGHPSSISGTTLTLAANLLNNHDTDTVVYLLEFDQVVFEKSNDYNPATGVGTWSVLATLGIDWDNDTTYYEDTTSTNASYYRFRYKNSVTADPNIQYSDYSPVISASSVLNPQSIPVMINKVRQQTREFDQDLAPDDLIISFFGEAEDIIFGTDYKWKCLFKEATINMASNQQEYTLPSDFSHELYVIYNYVDSLSTLNNMSYDLDAQLRADMQEYSRIPTSFTNDYIYKYQINPFTKKMKVWPIPLYQISNISGNVTIGYFKKFTKPTGYDSVTDCDNPHLEELYAMWQIAVTQGDTQKADRWEKAFWMQLKVWQAAQVLSGRPQQFQSRANDSYIRTYN